MLDQSVFKQLKKRETYNSSCNRSKHFFLCVKKGMWGVEYFELLFIPKKDWLPQISTIQGISMYLVLWL